MKTLRQSIVGLLVISFLIAAASSLAPTPAKADSGIFFLISLDRQRAERRERKRAQRQKERMAQYEQRARRTQKMRQSQEQKKDNRNSHRVYSSHQTTTL